MRKASGALAATMLILMGVRRKRLPLLERAAEPRRADQSAIARCAQPPLAFARLGSLWADGARQCLVRVRFKASSASAGFSPQLRVVPSPTRRDPSRALIPIALPMPANDVGGDVAVALETAPFAKVRVLPKGRFAGIRKIRRQAESTQAHAA